MKRALFLNSDSSKPRCAVFQAGQIYGAAMQLCKGWDLDYVEIGLGENLPDPSTYDVVIFNYQHVSMEGIPPAYFSHCKEAIGFLYEARLYPADSPLHVPELTAGQLFDILISPDPTLEGEDYVWGMPRVIPRYSGKRDPLPGIVVSTYGFPSPWKDIRGIIEMMNKEFDEATLRINFTEGSHQVDTSLEEDPDNTIYESAMIRLEEDIKLAKPGITVEVTHEFMPDAQLVNWLGQSSVNVFLALPERGKRTGGALLASADMAIASRAPLLVSDNMEARHLSGCTYESLATCIERGAGVTETLYEEWSPQNFASRMDEKIREYLC